MSMNSGLLGDRLKEETYITGQMDGKTSSVQMTLTEICLGLFTISVPKVQNLTAVYPTLIKRASSFSGTFPLSVNGEDGECSQMGYKCPPLSYNWLWCKDYESVGTPCSESTLVNY